MADDSHRRLLNELNSLNIRAQRNNNNGTTLYEQFKKLEDFEAKKRSEKDPPPKDPKKVITKDEAQKLRESVLRANRPVNPWFTSEDINRYKNLTSPTNIDMASPRSAASPSPVRKVDPRPEPLYSPPEKRFESVQKERRIPVRVERTEHHYENPQPKKSEPLRSVLNTKPQMKRLVDFVPSVQRGVPNRNMTQTIENFTHLKELELIEAETQKRKVRLEQHMERQKNTANSDGRSSASTYYFSDDSSESPSKCEDIYVQRSQLPKCENCFSTINDVILQALGKSFHPTCFRCYHCNMCLDGIPFASDANDRVYCVPDYEKLFVPICTRCQDPVNLNGKPIPKSLSPMYTDIMKNQSRVNDFSYSQPNPWSHNYRR
ncbi:unnamed protein product [Bursaphelenchus xylophilus]|uniref:(pine wood nematode) hypothetical protein n=1 Tax=Bursaphelenchus xylophilus TaxID=6326 RepID=A0A1I7RVT8_BURXY|nr:unnamed protein product [Bursaphelenchus xylophilus]CAG9082164.1 unnamed protein product [Bursaphelenchus xylophilus]